MLYPDTHPDVEDIKISRGDEINKKIYNSHRDEKKIYLSFKAQSYKDLFQRGRVNGFAVALKNYTDLKFTYTDKEAEHTEGIGESKKEAHFFDFVFDTPEDLALFLNGSTKKKDEKVSLLIKDKAKG